MSSTAEQYLNKLTELFGEEDGIRRVEPLVPNGSAVHVFYFNNLPEKGLLTAVTYGLSESDHSAWEIGKPELIVTLETKDEAWGMAAGFFASSFQREKSFSYGDIFTTDSPISEESEMSGYLCFAPSFLSKEQSCISLPKRDIYLKGMYPIYPEEVASYGNLGLKKFWHHPNFDMYDVNREKIHASI